MAPIESGGKAARLLAVLAAAWLLFCPARAHATSHEIFVQDCFYSNSAGTNNACGPPPPFGPPLTTVITAGDSVFWNWNNTIFAHTVTSDDGSFAGDCPSPTGCKGNHTSPSFTFTRAGSYGYHCDFHGTAGTNGQVGTGMAGKIVVDPGPVATLSFISGPPISVQAGTQFSVTVKGVDAFGNLGSGIDQLTFTSTDGQAALPPADTFLASGNGTFSITLKTAGTQTFRVTDAASGATLTSGTIQVTAAATGLYKVNAPGTVTANAAFTVSLTTTDPFGNATTGYNSPGPLTSITSSDAQATLPSAASVMVTNSSGSFSATLRTTPSETLSVSDGNISGTSPPITVAPLAATHFTISAPAEVTSGSLFSATVVARDQFGNQATSYNGTVTLTSSDGSATIPASQSLTNGKATFTAILVTTPSQTLTATDAAIAGSAGSATISVAPACSAAVKTISNTSSIANTGGPTNGLVQGGNPFPSAITVSGITGTVEKVTVQLNGLSSDCSNQLILLLVGPQGQKMVLMNAVGGNLLSCNLANNIDLTLDDGAPTALPSSTALTGGTFQPADYSAIDPLMPSPAPGAPYSDPQSAGTATFASVFNGSDPNGTWNLYVANGHSDSGHIAGGWSLTITPQQTFSNSAPISFTNTPSVSTSPYPSPITVSGLPGNITHMSLTLSGLNGVTLPLAVLLQGPEGQSFVPLAFAGNGTSVSNVTLTLDDAATATLPIAPNAVTSGTFKPRADHFNVDSTALAFNTPAPPAPFTLPPPGGSASFASVFNGTDPNGTWNLYVQSDAGGAFAVNGTGQFAGGWSLSISTDCPASSQAQLVTDVNPSGFDQPVTCTATVSSAAGTPAGTVQFLDGATVLSTQSLSGGSAQLVTSSLGLGPHSLSANYLGSTSFLNSVSAPVSQTVAKAATTTMLGSSQNPSIVNSSVTLTATVIPAFPGTPATGSVTFKDGATVLGSPALVGGIATFTSGALALGSHAITAAYAGDGNFMASNGAPLVQVVDPGPATHFTITGAPATTTAGTPFNATVTAFDQFNNTATTYSGNVHFTSSDAQAALPADSELVSGSGNFSITLKTAGNDSITAADSADGTIKGTANVQVNAAAANHMSINVPASATAGAAITVTVKAMDAFSNTVPGFRDTVHFASSDAQAVLPSNYTFLPADSGAHAFTNGVTLKTAGSESVMVSDASNGSITAASANATVGPGALGKFVLNVLSSVRAGNTFALTVEAEDAFNNQETGYAGTVHFTSSDPQAVLPADSGLSSGNSVFTPTLKTAGAQSISTNDTVSTGVTGTVNVSVAPASANHFVFSNIPASAFVGAAFGFTLTAKDSFNNTATSYPGTVQFSSTDATALLPLDSTLNSGTNSFNANLLSAGSQTITATDSVATSITGTSSAISVGKANSKSSLNASITVAYFQHPATLAVTVANASGSGTPSGTVDLLDNGVKTATATLDRAGHASFDTRNLRFGIHQLTAVYNGDANFNISNSNSVTVRRTPARQPLP